MDYVAFKRNVLDLLGIDLNSYKEQQMQRRILQWIDRYDLKDFSGLINYIKSAPDHSERFLTYLTINTSYFFRDTAVFKFFDDILLPEIASVKPAKIWSAGSSIGAEAYSLVILLLKKNLKFHKILGTDLDTAILEKATEGIFLANHLNDISQEMIDKYFTVMPNSQYKIDDRIRNHVTFKQHDLLKDPFPTNFDLILCRNVFIYFTSEVQQELTEKFVSSLNPGGYFVVGSAEQIMNPAQFGLSRVSYCIYKKA